MSHDPHPCVFSFESINGTREVSRDQLKGRLNAVDEWIAAALVFTPHLYHSRATWVKIVFIGKRASFLREWRGKP